VLFIFPRVYHGFAGLLLVPHLVLAVIISHFFGGNPHSPSQAVLCATYAVYTIGYCLVFLVIYVILLEAYLLRQVLHHLDDATNKITGEQPDSKLVLEDIGRAIGELETRRRKHFLLQPGDLNLTDAPHLLAAKAMSKPSQAGPVKKILAKFESKIRTHKNQTQSTVLLSGLKKDAVSIVATNENPPAGQ
jgi:hypothetical protein